MGDGGDGGRGRGVLAPPREQARSRIVRASTKPPRARSARDQFSRSKKVRTWSYKVARINLASESRKWERAARSAAQGGEAVSWTFLFCKCRFEKFKAEDFWREDFLEGNADAEYSGVLAPPAQRAQDYSSPLAKLPSRNLFVVYMGILVFVPSIEHTPQHRNLRSDIDRELPHSHGKASQ